MKNWLSKQENEFNKDNLRLTISHINWKIQKKIILSEFERIVNFSEMTKNSLFYYDYKKEEPLNTKSIGFDGVGLRFTSKMTGNGNSYKNESGTKFDYHMQEGATLHITYSATGFVLVFLTPSTSKDSLAANPVINLFSTYNPSDINPMKIKSWVKNLYRYQRVTGVLHRTTLGCRLAVNKMKFQSYFKSYLFPDDKFKNISGLYIPGWTLVFSIIAVVIGLYQMLNIFPNS